MDNSSHSTLGTASLVIGLLASIALVSTILSFDLPETVKLRKDPKTSLAAVVLVSLPLLLTFTSIVLGVLALAKDRQKKILPIIGLIVSTITTLSAMLLIFYFMLQLFSQQLSSNAELAKDMIEKHQKVASITVESKKAPASLPPSLIVVSIDAQSNILLEGNTIQPSTLREHIEQHLLRDSPSPVLIRAHRNAKETIKELEKEQAEIAGDSKITLARWITEPNQR